MSALAIHAALSAAVAAPAAAVPTTGGEASFAALLGMMSDARAKTPHGEHAGRPKSPQSAAEPEAPAAALTVLQSLEAALSGLGAPAAASAAPRANAAAPPTTTASASISPALAALAGKLDGVDWDASGATPLKALLQSDPALGLSDFQVKTHLAAAGATPARAGAVALASQPAWPSPSQTPGAAAPATGPDPFFAARSDIVPAALPKPAAAPPLTPAPYANLAASAQSATATVPTEFSTSPKPAVAAQAVAAETPSAPPTPRALSTSPDGEVSATPAAASPRLVAGATASPAAAIASAVQPSVATAPHPAEETPRAADRSAAPARAAVARIASTSRPAPAPASLGLTSDDPIHGPSTPAAADRREGATALPQISAPADAAAAPALSVPFAELPAFIASQADALIAETSTAATPPAPVAQARAAQAVKELHIALEPGELGEMTLKLRLSGGKLSVVIDVANPKTLSAIEDDRTLIAARLGAGETALETLVIQRQAPVPSSSEAPTAHAFAQDSDPSSNPERSPRERRPSAGARRNGGAFGDLLV